MNIDIQTPLDAGLLAIDVATSDSQQENALLIRAKCRGLLRGYDARWINAGYLPLEVEQTCESELFNPATKARSRSFRLAGKIDVLAEINNRRILFDHKTTSHAIADPGAPYWRQLAVEGQVSHYFLLKWLNGQKIDQAVWDVVRKPSIDPKKLTKAEKASVIANGRYFDAQVSMESRQALQIEDRETFEMYEHRLAWDCTRERHEWYFQRKPVARIDGEILQYAEELWQHSQDILHSRKNGEPPRNSGACLLYNTACKFLGICSGHDTPDSDRWKRKRAVHAELPTIEGDGRDVLTNSRIRCFQTCRRKHYYEYELGIERQDEEEKEALFFGSVWHSGLEHWWLSLIGDSHVDSASNEPVNAIGFDSAVSSQEELAS